jgi:hypothetical protein
MFVVFILISRSVPMLGTLQSDSFQSLKIHWRGQRREQQGGEDEECGLHGRSFTG